MYLFIEVIFYSDKRRTLPKNGYRPDAIFENNEYWRITFLDLPLTEFDVPTFATIKFTIQEKHYSEVYEGQSFFIMEGNNKVAEATVVSIEKE